MCGELVREQNACQEAQDQQQQQQEEGALLDRIHKMTDVAHELGALRLIVVSSKSVCVCVSKCKCC